MPEGDQEAQVPGHGVDVAVKVGLQAPQGGHQVGPAVCASGRVRNLMNLLHQYRAETSGKEGQIGPWCPAIIYTINYTYFPSHGIYYLQPSASVHCLIP